LTIAPAERVAPAVVLEQSQQFAAHTDLCNLLNAVPTYLLVLNSSRQVVFANSSLLRLLNLDSAQAVFGLRPGDVLDCEHAFETGGGCGLGPACATCGAARAIATCEHATAAVQECRITQKRSGLALDLRVSATPFQIGSATFTILALTDISHEKRRRALERIFLHDLLNTVGAVSGYAELLKLDGGEGGAFSQSISRLAATLAEEIRTQRELLAAENHDLTVHWETLASRAILTDVATIYHNHEAARGRQLLIDPAADDVTFTSDRTLLTRVISNMTKNGLEACRSGEVVTMGCKAAGPDVEFWVHNPGQMNRDVQLQVFQRSFSTKGAGRGLGSYSIKLLTERYLDGRVSFTSTAEQGTTFRVLYPRQRAGS
jgi:signal transduction histidine kinase